MTFTIEDAMAKYPQISYWYHEFIKHNTTAEQAKKALEMIAGERVCIDSLMSDKDIAREALAAIRAAKAQEQAEQPVSQEYQDHLVNQSFDWAAMAAKHQFMEGYRIGLAEMREKCAVICEAKQSYSAMHANTEFAAVIRSINFEGDTGFRPVSEMVAEHKQDPKKAAAIEKAKMRKAEQEPVAIVDVLALAKELGHPCPEADAAFLEDLAKNIAAPLQAQIDRLMLEYCPVEMTPGQLTEPVNQEPVDGLLPCPFCGDNKPTVFEGSTFRWRVAVCNNCGAYAPEVRHDTLAEDQKQAGIESDAAAIVAWNTRAAPVRTKDLTKEEIQNAMMPIEPTGKDYFLRLARAVIALYREKNK